jgi:2,4-dienoyl-CoA reductase [(3E)-enoyl-CoA-producing], peroxisomal
VIAGAAGNFIAPLSGLSPNAFKAVIDIDTLGTFNTVKATVEHLVASAARNPNPSPDSLTGGRILAVSATFHYTGQPLQAHVSAAKAAVDSLMASVALEYGPLGVTANVIAPGPIEATEGMSRLGSPDMVKLAKGKVPGIPSGRWGLVKEIADATVYLFGDAGNYVNGHILVVDGASWRRPVGVGLDRGMEYPNFLLTGEFAKGAKSGRKSKL